MKVKVWSFCSVAVLLCGSALAAGTPVIYVARTTGPIVVDGRFDEPQWKTADAIRDFGQATFMNRRPTVLPETWTRVLWDDRYLYVAMRCGEDHLDVNLPRLKTHAMNSSLPPDHRESVELQFVGDLKGQSKIKCHIVLSGEKIATRWSADGSNAGFGAGADWDYKAVIDEKGWQFEARFALADFGIPAREGHEFAFEPCRIRNWKDMLALDGTERRNQTRFVAWGTQGVHHNTTCRFGHAILAKRRPDGVPPPPAVADASLARSRLAETQRLLAQVEDYHEIRTNVADLVRRVAVEPVSHIRYSRFVRDGVTCLGYEKTGDANETFPMKATLHLPKASHVYDIREGRYLGCTTNVALTLKGLDNRFFALLPYEVREVAVSAPESVKRGETLVVDAGIEVEKRGGGGQRNSKLQTPNFKLQTHVLRFELIPPGGYSEERFAPVKFKLVDAPKGKAAAEFAIAWNEAYDHYDLVVTDVLTGVKTRRRVSIF